MVAALQSALGTDAGIKKVLNVRLLPTYMVFGSALDFSNSQLPDNTWVNHGETPVFVYRSGWESSDDTYFAIKGGRASTNHAHKDGKTLYLKFKGKVKAEAKIWPDHKYREYEIVDKNLRRVGFVMQLKANQTVDIEVSMLGEID